MVQNALLSLPCYLLRLLLRMALELSEYSPVLLMPAAVASMMLTPPPPPSPPELPAPQGWLLTAPMDALVIICSRKWTILWFGHGCSGYHMPSKMDYIMVWALMVDSMVCEWMLGLSYASGNGRYHGLCMDTLAIVCSRNWKILTLQWGTGKQRRGGSGYHFASSAPHGRRAPLSVLNGHSFSISISGSAAVLWLSVLFLG